MGWFGHKDLGYEIYWSKDEEKWVLTTNECFGCATEWIPRFKTRLKQEAIELFNYLKLHKVDPYEFKENCTFETKNYTFKFFVDCRVFEVVERSKSPILEGAIEIIHRKESKIKKLKSELRYQKYETLKYKTMLFDLYDKMQEKDENTKYQELIKLIYGGDQNKLLNKIKEE